jgi:hypothetical protein
MRATSRPSRRRRRRRKETPIDLWPFLIVFMLLYVRMDGCRNIGRGIMSNIRGPYS